MYYKIIIDQKPKVSIAANNDRDARMIAHELYPGAPIRLQSINREAYLQHGRA